MPLTDRMITGAIAANPGRYEGAGEYRYCGACEAIFFTRAAKPETAHDQHVVVALPALNQDASDRMSRAFQVFIKQWPEQRRQEIEQFALRRGWDLAMEHHDGGGALDDDEVAQWRTIVEAELRRLVGEARKLMATR